MDHIGQHFLAHTTLAGDQHARVGRRDPVHELGRDARGERVRRCHHLAVVVEARAGSVQIALNPPEERLVHIKELKPELCTLDCGTMNFASGGDYIMVNTPGMFRAMAKGIQELGVKPEVEIFDTGGTALALARRGDAPLAFARVTGKPALTGMMTQRIFGSRSA